LLCEASEHEARMTTARNAARTATAFAALCLVVASPDPLFRSRANDLSDHTEPLEAPKPLGPAPAITAAETVADRTDNVGQASASDAIALISDSRLGRAAARAALLPQGTIGYAPIDGQTMPDMPPPARLVESTLSSTSDLTGVRETLAFYKKGDLAGGDAAARQVQDPLARTLVEWIALRTKPREAGYERLMGFTTLHPDWPGNAALLKRAEEALYGDHRSLDLIRDFFATHAPASAAGKLALARLRLADGEREAAASLVREVWRTADINAAIEAQIHKDYGDLLRVEDYKYRADRLLYREDVAGALRSATLAGPDVLALAKARAAVINEAASDDLLGAVPESLRRDAGYIFAKVQKLRRADKFSEAASLILAAPKDPGAVIDGDEWWVERRLIARKLLDQGDALTAYRIAADHAATSAGARVEAEFHAGWIALRFLDDASTAFGHFTLAREAASTPMSRARAAYWQGRAIEVLFGLPAAHAYYEAASAFPATFYGQLAHAKLGRTDLHLRAPQRVAVGDERNEAIRVVEALYSLGEADLALPLISSTAENLTSEDQLAALCVVTARYHDAHATLVAGKLMSNRGFALDALAFPSFGVPGYQPTEKSVDRSIVYAITRQESAFHTGAQSSAGARGLMQLMPATARRTAEHAGLGFSPERLISDPAYNAQVGSTHLGELLVEQGGSLVLTFAAYNAGGKRVKEWIDAYGDPRDSRIDPVDWIELIPITETRNYVQRIFENLQIYRKRLGERTTLMIESDLYRSRKSR
jgi:soluble lytic murein transglycosylase